MATRQVKNVQMCCVAIGYQHFLMPFDKGMRLVELMQHAVSCQQDWHEHQNRYVIGEQPTVEFVAVKPNQVVAPSSAPQIESF